MRASMTVNVRHPAGPNGGVSERSVGTALNHAQNTPEAARDDAGAAKGVA